MLPALPRPARGLTFLRLPTLGSVATDHSSRSNTSRSQQSVKSRRFLNLLKLYFIQPDHGTTRDSVGVGAGVNQNHRPSHLLLFLLNFFSLPSCSCCSPSNYVSYLSAARVQSVARAPLLASSCLPGLLLSRPFVRHGHVYSRDEVVSDAIDAVQFPERTIE